MDLPPVLAVARPFLCDVHHCQVQHFYKAVVGGEHGFELGCFPELAVKPFETICRVDQKPDRFLILEISGQGCPSVVPGFVDFRVFGVPFVPKQFQLIQGGLLCRGSVYAF